MLRNVQEAEWALTPGTVVRVAFLAGAFFWLVFSKPYAGKKRVLLGTGLLTAYLAVFFVNMALSALLTSGLHTWLGVSENVIKIPVDILLFFVSYTVQQRWVFRKG